MNFIQLVLFFLACFIVYFVSGILIVDSVWHSSLRVESNNAISAFTIVTGILFAIIIGSTLIALLKYYYDASYAATKEADLVGDLFQLAPNTDLIDSPRLKTLLVEYSKNVIDVEWPSMRKSINPTSGHRFLMDMQKVVSDFRPRTHQDDILLKEIRSKHTKLVEARRKRIAASLNNIPFVIYILIFVVSALLMFFTFFFGLFKSTQMLFCFCLSILISLCIAIIVALDCPFRSQIRINPIEMQRVNKLIVGSG